MIKFTGKHAMATATLIALGGGAVVVTPGVARASAFTAAYTCTVPVLGARAVTIYGALTASPGRAVAGRRVNFHLRISRLNLMSPVPIDSWTAVAGIEVSGAQSAGFRMSGSGGALAPRQPVSGDLYGSWTPRVQGTDYFRGLNVLISARVTRLGLLTATCVPSFPRPVMEIIGVAPLHRFPRSNPDV